MLRSFPSPSPAATATEEPAPKLGEQFQTPSAEIRSSEPPASKAPKAEARSKPAAAATPRESVVDERAARAVESRRSTLNVEPVRAVEPREPLDRRMPAQLSSTARAFQPTAGVSESSRTTAVTIRLLEERWQEAIMNHDVAVLDKLLADDLEATSSTGAKGGKATLLRTLRNDKNVYKSVRAREMSVKNAGPDTVVVTGVTVETGTTADGRPFKISRRFTDTWKRRDGRWECVATEATQSPGR